MTWKRYPEYNDSGIEWLGDVPKEEDWAISRLSFLFTRSNAGEVIDKSYWGEGNEQLFTCARESLRSDFTGFPLDKMTTERDLLLTRNGTPYVHKPPAGAIYSNVVQRITLKLGYNKDFLSYSLGVACLGLKGYGVSIESLNFEMWKSLRLAFPREDEQRTIAAFLDRETEHIDTLIAKKERQIELLQEKRTALISHAVTKGLNPDAKMKDSGIEWLGEIPEQWKILAIKRITSIPITDGPHETPEILDEGIPFISAEAIKNDKIDFAKMRGYISLEDHARFSRKYKPERGDIYLIKSGATTGNVAFVDTDDDFNIWSPLAAIRPDPKKAITPFVFFFMKSKNFFQSIELGWSYGTQQNIGMNVIENIPIALPPLKEQCAIAAFLDRETERIGTLISKVQGSIAKLREYRTAIISAAVTGKIDVRKEVA